MMNLLFRLDGPNFLNLTLFQSPELHHVFACKENILFTSAAFAHALKPSYTVVDMIIRNGMPSRLIVHSHLPIPIESDQVVTEVANSYERH